MPYQMNNGKWRAHRMIEGKRKTKTFSTKKEAKKWEANQSEEKWEKRTLTVSLGEWSTKYLDMALERFSNKTYMEKRSIFRFFFQDIDHQMDAQKLTPRLAQGFLGKCARERSGHAANKYRKNLMAAWSWGVKYMGLPDRNPFKAVERYPENRQPRYVPPAEHMDIVLENETGEVYTFLLTMLHTAARRGELLRLRWGDLDFEREMIWLATRKRKDGTLEYDSIPMTKVLRQELLRHKKGARSVYVFCGADGQPFLARQHLMKRVCKRNNVPYFGFHAIRHLSASLMDRDGVPVATIQAILRHKSRATTERYLHQLSGVQADLDKVFNSGKIVKIEKASEG